MLNDIEHDTWDHETLTFLYHGEHGMTPVFYEGNFVTLKTDGTIFFTRVDPLEFKTWDVVKYDVVKC